MSNETPSFRDARKEMILSTFRSLFDAIIKKKVSISERFNPDMKEYNEVVRPTKVFTIPDIHGDVIALRMSLESMRLIDSKGKWIGGSSVVQFLGDYIDRGQNSLDVFDFLIRLQKDSEKDGGHINLLVGNHEAMMLGAIADVNGYRDLWMDFANGGNAFVVEISRKYNLKSMDALWERMGNLFLYGGKYSALFSSMKLVSQVDDVLYVHGGLNLEWASQFHEMGYEGMNQMWSEVFLELEKGNYTRFHQLMDSHSPLWLRYKLDIETMDDDEIAGISDFLNKKGVNAVVVGHDILPFGSEIHEGFKKQGIKMIATDVEISSRGGFPSSCGGIQIDKKGLIKGYFGSDSYYIS